MGSAGSISAVSALSKFRTSIPSFAKNAISCVAAHLDHSNGVSGDAFLQGIEFVMQSSLEPKFRGSSTSRTPFFRFICHITGFCFAASNLGSFLLTRLQDFICRITVHIVRVL